MYPIYRDLRERLGEPLWHDRNGVPRYAEFHPSLLGIYDKYAALFLVECQACGKVFPCAAGTRAYLINTHGAVTTSFIPTAQDSLRFLIEWGDAPWHDEDDQCSGTTMTTSIVDVLSVWERPSFEDWRIVEVDATDYIEEGYHGYEREGK